MWYIRKKKTGKLQGFSLKGNRSRECRRGFGRARAIIRATIAVATLVFPLARLIVGHSAITTIACLAVTRITGNAQVFLALAPGTGRVRPLWCLL